MAAALAVAILARLLRRWREQRVGSVMLTYPDRMIRVQVAADAK